MQYKVNRIECKNNIIDNNNHNRIKPNILMWYKRLERKVCDRID